MNKPPTPKGVIIAPVEAMPSSYFYHFFFKQESRVQDYSQVADQIWVGVFSLIQRWKNSGSCVFIYAQNHKYLVLPGLSQNLFFSHLSS